jgi:hypothetical protein
MYGGSTVKRFYKSERGSVSLYLAIILTAIIFFNTILIDFARVKAAERQSELALETAMRSLLSNYESSAQKYGLYGMKYKREKDALKDFEKILKANYDWSIEEQHTEGLLNFLDTRVEDEDIKVDFFKNANLGTHEVFREQILEEMKYRAPIEYGLELSELFKNMKGLTTAVEQAEEVTDKTSRLEQEYNRRQEAIDKAEQTRTSVNQTRHHYVSKMKDITKQVDDLRTSEATQISQINESNKTDTEKTEAIKDVVDSTNASLSQIKVEVNQIRNEIKGNMNKVSNVHSPKESPYNQISIAERAQESLKQLRFSTSGTSQHSFAGVHQNFNSSVDRFLLHDSFFEEYRKELKSLHNTLAKMDDEYHSFGQNLGSTRFPNGETHRINITTANNRFIPSIVVANNIKSHDEMKDIDEKLKSKFNKEREKADKAKQEGNTKMQDVRKSMLSNMELNTQLTLIAGNYLVYEKYKKFNQELNKELNNEINKGSSDVVTEVGYVEDPSTENTLKMLKGIKDSLNGVLTMLETAGENAYVTEYALNKFNNFRFHENGSLEELSDPSDHLLVNQEFEYILYGFPLTLLNYEFVMAEIWVYRFIFNLIDELINNRHLLTGGIWGVIAYLAVSISKATFQAAVDVEALLFNKGGNGLVPLVHRTPVVKNIKLDYKDYLRLIMITHSSNESLRNNMYSRMQTLITINSGNFGEIFEGQVWKSEAYKYLEEYSQLIKERSSKDIGTEKLKELEKSVQIGNKADSLWQKYTTDHFLTNKQTYVEGTVTTSVRLWFPQIFEAMKVTRIFEGEIKESRYYIKRKAGLSY